jgi:hypothetical protein
MKLSDIDLEAELNAGSDRVDKTQQQYNLWLRRFCEFCEVDFTSGFEISPALFNDRALASFLLSKGKEHDHVPHVKKSIISSLNYALGLHGLSNLSERSDCYPFFTRAKQVILYYFEIYYFYLFCFSNGKPR